MDEKQEPTEEEKKNGWTAETLTAYLAQREAERRRYVASGAAAGAGRSRKADNRYDPFKW